MSAWRSTRIARPAVAGRLLRFALLWWSCLAAILLIAGVETLILWQRGYTYTSKSALHRVWVSELSINDHKHFAAALVTSMQNASKASWNDVVLLDLQRCTAKSLELRDLLPRRVAMLPGSNSLAVAAEDGSIYALTAGPEFFAGKELPTRRLFTRCGDEEVERLAFSADGSQLTAIGNRFVSAWAWPSGTLIHRFPHNASSRDILDFSPDSHTVLSASGKEGLRLTAANSLGRKLPIDTGENGVVSSAMSFDSQLIAVSTYCDVSVEHFDGHPLWQETYSAPMIALDSQRRILAVASNQNDANQIDIRDLVSGRQICRLDGQDTFVAGITFATDGLLYSWDYRGGVHAWDIERRRLLWSLFLPQSQALYNNAIAVGSVSGRLGD